MKSYTTKANAKRAAKRIQVQLNDRIEEITFAPTFKEDTGFGIFVVLNDQNTREDWADTKDLWPHIQFSLREAVTEIKKETPKRNKSGVSKPCNMVWDMAEKMEGAKRKDVIEACVKAGVAFYTARTQYQLWKQATNV